VKDEISNLWSDIGYIPTETYSKSLVVTGQNLLETDSNRLVPDQANTMVDVLLKSELQTL